MTPLILLLEAGFSLWNSKEKNKYSDELIKLKREYYAEEKKPQPDHAVLDNIEFELWALASSFSSLAKGPKA